MGNAQPSKMAGLLLQRFTGFEGVEWKEDLPVPKPQKGEVLIKIYAAPINPSDLIFLAGKNPLNQKVPRVPGFEGAGIVVETGKDSASKALLGKRVACRTKPALGGTWAEYMVTDSNRCIPLISKLSLLEGASFLVNPLTAWALIHTAKEEGHRAAIQTAAASTLGKMIVRLGKKVKFPLINVVRRDAQVEELKKLGARYVLNSNSVDFAASLSQLSQDLGATVCFDAVSGELSNTLLKVMPSASQLWVYGGLSQSNCEVDPAMLIYEQKVVRGFWGPPRVLNLPPKKVAAITRTIQNDFSTIYKTEIATQITPKHFKAALTPYWGGLSKGKMIFIFDKEV